MDTEVAADMGGSGYRRDLGEGLVLRWSTAQDVEGIVALYGHVFRQTAEEPLNPWVAGWTRDMMSGRHPHIGPHDFAMVQDRASGDIVSASCLLSYEIEIEGVRVPFGRPEAVATHPGYRDRGLVRALFELLHARSAARGHLLQGITGIPHYYRLFGYEYAADLGGEVSVYFAAIPPLKKDEREPYSLRVAAEDELATVRLMFDHDRSRYALSTPVGDTYWRWVASGQRPESGEGWSTRVVVDPGGGIVGYVLNARVRDAEEIKVIGLGAREGVSLGAMLPSVLRGLQAASGEPVPRRGELPAPARICLQLWRDHPVYGLLAENQLARRVSPYAWYLRVPDVISLLLRLRHVLDRRLAASPLAGYTGELRVTFYPRGMRMLFDGGRLTGIEEWRQDHAWGPRPQAGFPPQVFARLLFGYQCLADLRVAFPDVRVDDLARPLVEALFPRRPTWLVPLD